jgi:hypothetical protein
MGKDNHVVVSHKLFGFQGHVGGCIVVMKEPVVVVPKLWFFSLHIFSQVSQNVTAEVRVDHSFRKNRFMVNSPLHVKKNNEHTVVGLRSCHAIFALGDCGLFHCDDCCFVSGS